MQLLVKYLGKYCMSIVSQYIDLYQDIINDIDELLIDVKIRFDGIKIHKLNQINHRVRIATGNILHINKEKKRILVKYFYDKLKEIQNIVTERKYSPSCEPHSRCSVCDERQEAYELLRYDRLPKIIKWCCRWL